VGCTDKLWQQVGAGLFISGCNPEW